MRRNYCEIKTFVLTEVEWLTSPLSGGPQPPLSIERKAAREENKRDTAAAALKKEPSPATDD